ncbi:hypothetical protein IRP63_04210 [Clostridium botulinum]|uniref:Peptidase S1 domain-containing protein n=1 Tax=Clostridium botulinum C/D str. DC5 TaxID=1443128 RepID=A0A0A0IGE1_CLOBO|nr:trypsin-like serine protease [Clostridium botulinum]KEI00925.1 hypothetical protein Z952_13160 [Clostridium botulinum C/D str. BKT75002]KEI11091.1 hypothetical protein Z954_09020 [Clostridium botulinum C/D str. BKT2873]KGM94094.1 hypothetical protein Z956_09260 [Clostridium botulinum D str. CCUG 7971]KGN00053.1 hypothetical protein Z955_04840 [Clostridium botulinum C/D str. DC5]KOC50594.1 hypothetical protein ADU88_02055 [Clostridium botulinum]
MNKLCNIDEKILSICNCNYDYFFKNPNVVGIGLGYKITNGFCTHKKCIKVFVKSKISSNSLSNETLIPQSYEGIETDITSTGIFESSSFTSRIRPVLGGYSVGPRTIPQSGTAGCLVRNGTDYYLLSTNHVLTDENTVPLGTTIVQPGINDGGRASRDAIGKLSKFIPLIHITPTTRPENFVDCAIAKLSRRSILSPNIAVIGKLNGTHPPILESHVEKSGRTSELTLGQITSLGTTIKVNLPRGQCLFKHQIIATKMSEKGDSGAILVDSNNFAIGLLIGSSTCNSIFNPIDSVLHSLNVTLVTS